ncbi:carboxylesterase/lipase family protein [Kitasatospora sp. NPDC048540]|uniref:carboxylesterase/lipase family protein n=1 Tax=Kitasatospora sp. NPDC048540 TaxID=3155634 RepID=UPI0033CA79BF
MHPVVRTTHGLLRGTRSADGVAAFRNIPYAAPPVGPLRLLPPQPPARWDGERDATAPGPTAPQAPYAPPLDVLLPEITVPGEDCLNLNVWTPDTAARLPVMVWLHGGAFTNGAGSLPMYDGSAFARDGVVLVTLNYRLGAEGFLDLPGTTPNRGLLDQIAALTWVRDGIAAFGGDPANVTVFGQSAGAMSIATLLAVPRARGLFHRAILQSGAAHHTHGRATAGLIRDRLAELLGTAPEPAAIAALPTATLVEAQQRLRAAVTADPDPARWGEAALNLLPFEPVVDGDILPRAPIDAVSAGAAAGIDLMAGTTTEEFRLYLAPTGLLDAVPEAALPHLTARYGLPPGALDRYRAGRPDASPGELLAAVATDWFYRIPAIRLAEAHARHRPAATYLYEFAWRSPAFDGRLGACHAVDVPFTFGVQDDRALAPMLGDHPPRQLADAVRRAWTSFATTGDPGWPPYTPDGRATRVFDTDPLLVTDPRPDERSLWDGRR